MSEFASVVMKFLGSAAVHVQSYGSVDDLLAILCGLAGLAFLVVILLMHDGVENARRWTSGWHIDRHHLHVGWPGHRKH
ncbi:hypothetical protein [Paraburkholderia lacunae]|uniref:Uncharacterized protein n=1 Tax=Paraburkholderia lacunae TaxID=2211104 RepID=A0A370N640_9BURK|nr:hypothetical protein [Paraburkholderia lacunae]RDK01076.1 hypothetical protein DLM46_19970 [Paraburkholderia lacunae]